MLLSLVVYIGMGLMLFYLGWHYNRRMQLNYLSGTTKSFLTSWEIIASISLFTIIAALRYHTGWDHEDYIIDYTAYQNKGLILRDNFEIGFSLVKIIFATLGLNYSVFFGFWGFLNIFFLYLGLKDNPRVIPWVGLFVMLGIFFLHLMNTIRQGVVECGFVLLVMLLGHKKWVWYFVGALILSTIHKSAFLIIPLFLLIKYPFPIKKRHTLIIIYIVCFLLGQFSIFSWIMNSFSGLFEVLGYGKYVELFNTNPTYAFHKTSLGVTTLIQIALHLSFICYYGKMKDYFGKQAFFLNCFKITFIYCCAFVLLLNTTIYVKRPCELLLPFFLICSAYLSVYFYENKKYVELLTFVILNCSIIIFTLLKEHFISKLADSVNYYHFIPF